MIQWTEHAQSTAIYLTLTLGLASAIAVRCPKRRYIERISQVVFCGMLLLAGYQTIMAVGLGPGHWLSAASSFSVMVLAAVWDFGHAGKSRPYLGR